jgi:hypothetical protein
MSKHVVVYDSIHCSVIVTFGKTTLQDTIGYSRYRTLFD